VPTLERGLLTKAKTLNINFEYIIAVAALDGQVSWGQYSEERQRDPELQELWGRVSSEGDPELDELKDANVGARPARVTLTTRDGRAFDGQMIYPPGHPRNPLGQDELEEKFLYWSTRVLDRSQAVELRSAVNELERVRDIREIGDLLRV
jgi:2-methylcitrate dehydratase